MGHRRTALSGRSMLRSAAAGAVAVWVMDRFDWFVFEREDSQARRQTESVRPGGMDPAHALAAKAAAAAGISLKPAPPHQHPAGLALHYVVPMGLAVLYNVMKSRLPLGGSAKGALYGAGTFLLLDEFVNPLLGLAARPDRYPWQRHIRELATHMLYGAVTDRVMNLFESKSLERVGSGTPSLGSHGNNFNVCHSGSRQNRAGTGMTLHGFA